MKIPNCVVVLAAYNGMQYIEEQVRSILDQKNVRVTLVVSIDVSNDGTEEWFNKLAIHDSRVILLPHGFKFGGAAKNFFRLIREVDLSGFDCLALADQDDIWLPNKLRIAGEKLLNDGFAGYSGSVTAFWSDGRQIVIDKAQPQRKYDFLFEGAGPGCSYVLRAEEAIQFQDFLKKNWHDVNEILLHDWLIYAWFRANNMEWYIDHLSMIRYRQHERNEFGANHGFRAILGRLRMLRGGWYRKEIRKISGLLRLQLPEIPECMSTRGVVPRLFLIKQAGQCRRRLRDRWFFFVVVMLGIY